eukprot:SAG31_NODE_6604_length_1955_cov_1.174569_3_plen_71_part_00
MTVTDTWNLRLERLLPCCICVIALAMLLFPHAVRRTVSGFYSRAVKTKYLWWKRAVAQEAHDLQLAIEFS